MDGLRKDRYGGIDTYFRPQEDRYGNALGYGRLDDNHLDDRNNRVEFTVNHLKAGVNHVRSGVDYFRDGIDYW